MKLPLILALLAPIAAHAATNIAADPADSHAYGGNIGWINARGDVTNGAVIGEFVCSGYLYSANCGWIHLGTGTPGNGIRYQNVQLGPINDYGVNVQGYFANGTDCEAKLRGFAYGANIGWINFENGGDPRVNLATGKLLGYAWGANVGWIALSETGVNVVTTSIAPGADTDSDGIPDNWERFYGSNNLTLLTATGDRDGDGFLDKDEYAADTNPFSGSDRLQITALVPPRYFISASSTVTDLTWTSKPSRKYDIEIRANLGSGFAAILPNIAPGSGATTTARFDDAAAARKFYRVRARLPLAP